MKKTTLIFFILIAILFLTDVKSLSEELTASFHAGVNEYRSGNYTKAFNIMDKLSQIEPNNYYVQYYKAMTLVKFKKLDEAKQLYVDIINNSADTKLQEYAKNGLKLIDPSLYNKYKNSSVSIIEVEPKNKIEKTLQNNYNTENTTNGSNPNSQLSEQQQTIINQIAQKNNINPDEISKLIKLLASNPSALATLNKLAGSNLTTQTTQKTDPKMLAQMLKMMTMNSQMGMLRSLNGNDDENKNNNDSMNFMPMMAGQNFQNLLKNKNMDSNNMQALMNYMSGMNGTSNNNNFDMNPDMMNTLMMNNMFSGSGSDSNSGTGMGW